jgi:hemerythrin-like metal-binding protein
MAKLEWNDRLSVKVAVFDLEHKRLISIINKVDEAMSAGKGGDIVLTVLNDLVNYTKTHFTHEEMELSKRNYPGLENQKKEHAAFVSKIEQFRTDAKAGKPMMGLQVISFISSWITNHIMKTDHQYADFLNRKGMK